MTKFEGFDDLADGLKQLAENFDQSAALAAQYIDAGVERTAKQVERSARKNVKANGSIDTNALRQSIGYGQVDPGHYRVGTPQEYAPYVEYGRGPITADEGYLRFVIDNEVYYRKSVGPAPAKPFLRPALREHQSDLARNIEREIERLFEDVF